MAILCGMQILMCARFMVAQRPAKSENYKTKLELESVSIPSRRNSGSIRKTSNAVNSREKVKSGGMVR